MQQKVLITGSAGFIGFHVAKRMLEEGYDVTGIDNLNEYYDVKLKLSRLKELGIDEYKFIEKIIPAENKLEYKQSRQFSRFRFVKMDICEKDKLVELVKTNKFDYIIHLAAQAGVRYSITNPQAYIDSNIVGFFNILESLTEHNPKHFVFASSSSVYGENSNIPFKITDNTDHPVSLYAATKKSNEVMAHAYSSLFGIPTTGLRFFTVYGPYGRPDMAYYSFTEKILSETQINLFNSGNLQRDFTYIDDVVESIFRVAKLPPTISNIDCKFPYSIFNIGNSKPVELNYFVSLLEKYLSKKAIKVNRDMQKGDVYTTYSDVSRLYEYINYKPIINIEEGLSKFCTWYLKYHR